jgi:phosphatidate cytidylyltransferase
MKQRIITAVIFAAAMLGGIFYCKHAFFWLFVIIAGGCLWELMGLLLPKEEKHFRFRRIVGCTSGILVLLFFGHHVLLVNFMLCGELPTPEGMAEIQRQRLVDTFSDVFLLSSLFTFLLLVVELFLGGKSPFSYIGNYLAGLIYISMPIMMLFSIAETPDGLAYSPLRVFGLLLLIWTNDTMAYFIGSQLGKRKLFERISPNKTWEGTIGGGLCTVLVAWGLSFIIKDFTPAQWLALGAVATVFGTFGDLVESMLKRSVGVKDSGNLLPGHGGLLDRFDSFIFALPFFWLALMIFKG